MINSNDVKRAYENINKSIYKTPLIHSPILSYLTGANVQLKLENLQKTGSFKARGAINKILQLTDEEKRR